MTIILLRESKCKKEIHEEFSLSSPTFSVEPRFRRSLVRRPSRRRFQRDSSLISDAGGYPDEIEVAEQGKEVSPGDGQDLAKFSGAEVLGSGESLDQGTAGFDNGVPMKVEISIHIYDLTVLLHQAQNPGNLPLHSEILSQFLLGWRGKPCIPQD
jgi:hypothetical protein